MPDTPLSDIETLKEIWQFMATSQQMLKITTENQEKINKKIEDLVRSLDHKCDDCPFAQERKDYTELKKNVNKIILIGGIIIFIISVFVAPVVVRLVTN
jgi:t-SNARE complex subunit (syntaxin)